MKTLISLIAFGTCISWSVSALAQGGGGVSGRGPRTGNIRIQNTPNTNGIASGPATAAIGSGMAQANMAPGMSTLPASGMAQANMAPGMSTLPASGMAQANMAPGMLTLPASGIAQANMAPGMSTLPASGMAQANMARGMSTFPGTNMAQPNMPQGTSTLPGSGMTGNAAGNTSSTGVLGQSTTTPNTSVVVIPSLGGSSNSSISPSGNPNVEFRAANGQVIQSLTGKAAANTIANGANNWRMVNQNGQWWYWTTGNNWLYYNGTTWMRYSPTAPPVVSTPANGG